MEVKEALRANQPKFGCFVNSASPTVAEQVPRDARHFPSVYHSDEVLKGRCRYLMTRTAPLAFTAVARY